MKIATWNVNSVRARLERLLAWLPKTQPDIVCLQELKAKEEAFPHEAILAAGYHAAVYGQGTIKKAFRGRTTFYDWGTLEYSEAVEEIRTGGDLPKPTGNGHPYLPPVIETYTTPRGRGPGEPPCSPPQGPVLTAGSCAVLASGHPAWKQSSSPSCP